MKSNLSACTLANVFLWTGIVMETMTVVTQIFLMNLTVHQHHATVLSLHAVMADVHQAVGVVMDLMIVVITQMKSNVVGALFIFF